MMKKNIYLILIALLVVACDKFPNDQPLDGMWHLRSLRNSTGVEKTWTPEGPNDTIYWSFRRGLVQFRLEGHSARFAHYNHVGDSLLIDDIAFASTNATEADNNEWIKPDKLTDIHPWGLYPVADPKKPGRTCVGYRIAVLNSDDMVLLNETDTLRFRKL